MKTRFGTLLLGLPVLLLLALFFLAPYVDMVTMSLHAPGRGTPFGTGFTWANYVQALSDPLYATALWHSLLLGAVVSLLCLLLSYPLALHLARVNDRWHVLFYACIVSPLLVGVLVRNFGWMIILAVDGPFNRVALALGLIDRPVRFLFTPGVIVLGLVHVFVPFMVLPITNALRNTAPSLREASESLGAGRLTTFLRITLPLSFPGIQAGVILVFVLSVSAYVTPALLGGQGVMLLPQLIVHQLLGAFAWPFGATLALLMALAILLIVLGFTLLVRPLARRTAR